MRNTILKRDRVLVLPPGAPAPGVRPAARSSSAAGGDGGSPCDKRVRLLEREGIVHAVELACSCGSVTVIELTYPDGAPPTAATEAHR